MISTLTTASIELLASTANATMSLVTILTLIILMILKEIASGIASARMRRLNKVLDTMIVPLGVVFVATAVIRVAAMLHRG
jgi:hypothetical protein